MAAQLEPGDFHLIVQTTDLMMSRWQSLSLGEVICWVDDDDYVMNDAIPRCKRALEQIDAGIAFTNEKIAHDLAKRDVRMYSDVATIPSAIHHLAMFRTALMNQCVHEDYLEVGAGLEWLMKGYVALKHNAVHVPIDGYFWTQSPQQHSKTPKWINDYSEKFGAIQAKLRSYAGQRVDTLIPMHFVTIEVDVTI